MMHRTSIFLFAQFALFLLIAQPVQAEDRVWLLGQVVGSDGKTPLANAMVAVYDDKQKVIDFANTDNEGRYALLVDKSALHLKSGGGSGFLHTLSSGINRAVGGVAGIASLPIRAGMRAAAAAMPAADPLTRAELAAASSVADLAVRTVLPGMRPKAPESRVAYKEPGALLMKVSLPGYRDVVSAANVFWLEQEVAKVAGKDQRALIGWMDPVRLVGKNSDKASEIRSDNLYFTMARLEPSIAQLGQAIRIEAEIPQPESPKTPIIVIARHQKTGTIIQLQPDGEDRYVGELIVDKRFPANDQAICLIAYAVQTDGAGRDAKVEDAIKGAGLLDGGKEYRYNPLIAASRNRPVLLLTVVKKGKP